MRVLALVVVAMSSTPVFATELEILAAAGGGKTEWRSDVAASGTLEGGLTIGDHFAVIALSRLGYGTVDQRLLTLVSIGARYWTSEPSALLRPCLRFSLAHQHEESVSVIEGDPFAALFGIGDAIRHRGGFELGAGLDYALGSLGSTPLALASEVSTTWFYDDRGPHWFVAASVGLRARFML
ncbi:MAG: hypothetical protein HYV07_13815 [Deltaproteobacteria bacterium]|nr:hypothetical protein [Deltaproteobacteria bacterium]